MINRLRNMEGRYFWVLAAAGVLVALALILGANIQKTNAQNLPSNLRTTFATHGQIEELVKAPGAVSARSANLTFPMSGVISDLLVKPGSVVQAGQMLAKLDTSEAEANLAAAIAGQKSAQAHLDTIQNGPTRELTSAQQDLKIAQLKLEALKSPAATPEDLAAAQAAVDAATARYQALASGPNPKELAAAQASLNAAKAQLNQVKAGPLDADLKAANARLTAAQQNLENVKLTTADAIKQAENDVAVAQKGRDAAQAAFDAIHKDLYDDNGKVKPTTTQADLEREKKAKLDLDQADLTLQGNQRALQTAKDRQTVAVKEAEATVAEAQANLEKVQSGPNPQAVAAAQAEVDRAQAEYDRVAAGPSQDELTAAQSLINEARSNLDRLNRGASDKDIALAQAEVEKYQQQVDSLSKGPLASELAQAQGDLEKATAQVKQAQLRVDQSALFAPYNSVVEAINIAPGQSVSPGPTAMTVVDLANLTVNGYVSEANIQRIKLNQPVRIYFNSISGVRETPFMGKVSFIGTQPKPVPASAGVSSQSTSTGAALNTVAPDLPFSSEASSSGYPVQVQLDSDNQLSTLKPGMTGQVQFVLARKPDTLIVPKTAIRNATTGPVIDVVLPDSQIVTTPVTIGLKGEAFVEILKGGLLQAGDKIVVYGDTPLPTTTPSGTPGALIPGGATTPGGTLTPGDTQTLPTPVASVTPAGNEASTTAGATGTAVDTTTPSDGDLTATPISLQSPSGAELTASPATSPSPEVGVPVTPATAQAVLGASGTAIPGATPSATAGGTTTASNGTNAPSPTPSIGPKG
ncbi:MAG TPA: HlyD family efflux transporter periplasmic adaptor subunit [Chloroflexia bacterium]|nr:HlyD family efflux transporter periplasmic adaptor subunit [Chloroflexia bacterium]